jgi:hypothetical protein
MKAISHLLVSSLERKLLFTHERGMVPQPDFRYLILANSFRICPLEARLV